MTSAQSTQSTPTSTTSTPPTPTSTTRTTRVFDKLRTAWATEGRTCAARTELAGWQTRHPMLAPYTSPFDVTTLINHTTPEHADELLGVLLREAGLGSELARRALLAALAPVMAGVYKRSYCPAWQREDFMSSLTMHALRIIDDLARDYTGDWPLRTFHNRLEHTARRTIQRNLASATCDALSDEIAECERALNRSEELLRLLEIAIQTGTIDLGDADLLATKLIQGTPLVATARARGVTERVIRYRYDTAMNQLIANRQVLVEQLAA